MKTRIIIATLIGLSFVACKKDNTKDFELLMDKFNEDGGDLSGECPVGEWKNYEACGGLAVQNLVFYSDGTGWADNPDCNGICDPLVWPFNYEVIGNTCTLTYTQAEDVNCGGTMYPVVPPQEEASFTFTCNGNTLETSFGTFTK
jgi:hypothetical protein